MTNYIANNQIARRATAHRAAMVALLAGIAALPAPLLAQAYQAGAGASASGTNAVAVGPGAVAAGAGGTAIGHNATAGQLGIIGVAAPRSTALGERSTALIEGGVALGANSTDGANNNTNGVATLANTGPVSVRYNNAANTYIGAVSVGSASASQSSPLVPAFTRQIQNVADGSAATDAVTVRQLTGVASAANATFFNLGTTSAANFGGGVVYDSATGALSAPSYSVGGVAYNNVGAALGAQNGIVTALGNSAASLFGGPTSYNPATGVFTGQAFVVGGTTYTNVTSAFGAVSTALATQPLQYSTAAAPTTANPGVVSNDVTLVGTAPGTPVRVHNVAAGQVAAASTDAVNGSQLFATNNNVTNLTNGTAGLLQQVGGAPGNGVLTIGAATGGTVINVTGTSGPRVITGVGAGALTTTSTDAVNGAQLNATNTALAATNANVAGNTTAISNLTNGTAGLVQQVGGAPGNGAITVAAATGGTSVNFTGTSGARTLQGVGAGVLATDAVNVSQLGGVAAIANNSVQYDNAGRTSVTLGGAGGTRITNVAPGVISAASTDAVNGSQLNATNVAVAGNTAAITNLTNGTAGLVQQVGGAPGNGAITVAAATGGTSVNFTGTAGARTLQGVAAGVATTDGVNVGQLNAVAAVANNAVQYDDAGRGTVTLGGAAGTTITNVRAGAVTATSTDAVNGSQLAAQQIIVSNLGNSTAALFGGSTAYNAATGQLGGSAFTVGGTTYNNVTSAIGGINQALANVPVQYSTAAAPTTANGGVPTNDVTLVGANAGAPVAVHNVAAGAVTATSTDAVNGSQLASTNAAVATNAAGLTTLTSNINGGTIGLVQQAGGAPGNGAISVGGSTGGTSISVAGTQGPRTVSGVANGVNQNDAINLGQLNASAAQTLGASRLYTDQSIAAFDLRTRGRINQGVATAAAIAGVPQAVVPGEGFIGAGVGVRGSQVAVAVGLSKVFEGKHAPIVKAGVSFGVNGGDTTYNVGAGFHF